MASFTAAPLADAPGSTRNSLYKPTTSSVATISMYQPKSSITSKEWVIPPRPKPGRKPATDTPPTKRKAQNRAAQRAFRERRAARVGELEEELEDQREEHERAQQQLHLRIQRLNAEVESLHNKCLTLGEALERERAQRHALRNELESLRRRARIERESVSSRNGSFTSQTVQLQSISNPPDHRNSTSNISISQMISPPDSSPLGHIQASTDSTGCGNCTATGPCACVDEVLATTTVECGKCTLGSRCECLEAALNNTTTTTTTTSEMELKRKPSSSALEPEEKRQKADPYPNEIDFTAMFSSKKKTFVAAPAPPPDLPPAPQMPLQPRESCGFCTESSYCLCAAEAAEAAEEAAASQTLAPMSQQVQTPPPDSDPGPSPMEVTSTGAIKLPSFRSLKRGSLQQSAGEPSGCGVNGPGTCAQCLRDPKSGLFCRSLAAKVSRESGGPSGGCCGGSGGSGGCCKSGNTSAPQATSSSTGISLSCAATYQTLSRHPAFEQATDEIETWLPKLKAIPKPANTLGRTPMDVETASIMSVLKEFDVRFGRNG
ncbi:hypothetical protein F5Y17DRAFT_309342 [Xylariaceae sp. FL0594]|nr:hypothetical protein F5Y17DRAFT_309342 [Xylariaceae sp. FL0594]